jgi:hypothetical protein
LPIFYLSRNQNKKEPLRVIEWAISAFYLALFSNSISLPSLHKYLKDIPAGRPRKLTDFPPIAFVSILATTRFQHLSYFFSDAAIMLSIVYHKEAFVLKIPLHPPLPN